ncbi:DNA polymerase IV [Candidatus Omnitrophota bacterium]
MQDFITLSSYPKAIMHVDCDAFFTSCEQARDPSLKGRPVITGKERGIVSCASYEAKALGIKRAIRLSDVKKICKDAVVLPSDYELYSIYSERMFEILRGFTPMVEEYSIDEAFCDFTGMRRVHRTSYENIAKRIQKKIKKELDISVSIGVSPSKILAKVASSYRKPNGITAVPGRSLHIFLKGIEVGKVCGFGPNSVELLNKFGIYTAWDYIKKPKSFVNKILGKIGNELWLELQGNSVYNVSQEKKEKYITISKTKTFSPSTGKREYVKAQLIRNLESACIKLRRYGLTARGLTAYLKTEDFKDIGLETYLNRHSSSTLDFTFVCAEIFDELFKKGLVYRSTGIILSKIKTDSMDHGTLFDDPIKIDKMNSISKVVDELNSAYGKHTVHVASSNLVSRKKRSHPRAEVSRRKKDLLKGENFRQRLNMPLLDLGNL